MLVDGGDAAPPDLLEHQAIARALAAAIRGTSNERPLGVALYGGWGQGKSTIGRLLKEELKPELDAGAFVFVKIDAWKYAHEDTRLPLRRHFLLRAYTAAGFDAEAFELRQQFRLERTTKTPRIKLRDLAQSGRRFLSWLTHWTTWRALALSVVILLGGIFLPLDRVDEPFRWLVVGGSALLVFVVAVSPLLREGIFVTTRDDPSWSVEEFDERLSTLLQLTEKDVERFVFFIDDLDRCSDDLVVEAIATLQAFFGRSRCVYIVAADEKQLKRAIRSGSQRPARALVEASPVPADETFLEKIFHVSTYVPRPSLPAIQRYAREVSQETPLSELTLEERETVLTFLVHPRVVSPRQVRVIINDFTLAYAEAEEREAESRAYLPKGELTGYRSLLAKLVVLRSHFPWFHDLLYEDPGLLARWQATTLASGDAAEDDAELSERVLRAADGAIMEMTASVSRTGDPGAGESSEGVGTAEDLLEALRGYLSLTRDALPKDAAHMQEFLYLRSREEFADLVGEAGEEFRLALEAGDESSLRELASEHPDQAISATRAAIGLAEEQNPVQRAAGRRSLTTLLICIEPEHRAELAEDAAAALYRDEAEAIRDLPRDPSGYSLLIAAMPSGVIRQYALRPVLEDVAEVRALAERVAKLGEVEAWADIGEYTVAEQKAEIVASALADLQPASARALVRPTITAARAPLEGVVERVDGLKLTFVGVTEEGWVDFTDETGETRRMWWPLKRQLDSNRIAPGVTARVWAHRDHEDDFVLERIETGEDEVILSETRPEVTSPEMREAAWLLVETVMARATPDSGNELASLLNYSYKAPEDAERAVEQTRAALAREGWSPATSLANALANGMESEFASASLKAVGAMTLLPNHLLLEHLGQLLRRAAHLVAGGEALSGLTNDLLRLRATLEPSVLRGAALSVDLPDDGDAKGHVILDVLTPADPEAAGEALVSWISGLLRVAQNRSASDEDKEHAVAEMDKAFDVFDRVGEREPKAVRRSVRRLTVRSAHPRYAERLLGLRKTIGALRLVLPARLLRAAATSSRKAAEVAIDHGLQRPEMSRRQIEAVLAGIATFPPLTADLRPARRFMDRHRSTLSRAEQGGFLASQGGRETAERFYGDDLLKDIFAAALLHLHRDLHRAQALLEATRAWSSSPKRVRKGAAKGFVALFDAVTSESELAVVLSGALNFFERPDRVEHVRELKRSLKEVLARLTGLSEEETRTLLERAATQLRLQPTGQAWFDDAVADAFRP